MLTQDERNWADAEKDWTSCAESSGLPKRVIVALSAWIKQEKEAHQASQRALTLSIEEQFKKVSEAYKGNWASTDSRAFQNMMSELAEVSVTATISKQEESRQLSREARVVLGAALDAMRKESGCVDPLASYFYNEQVGLSYWFRSIGKSGFCLNVAVAWCESGLFEKSAMESLWKDVVLSKKESLRKFSTLSLHSQFKSTLSLHSQFKDTPPLELLSAVEAGGLLFLMKRQGVTPSASTPPAL